MFFCFEKYIDYSQQYFVVPYMFSVFWDRGGHEFHFYLQFENYATNS